MAFGIIWTKHALLSSQVCKNTENPTGVMIIKTKSGTECKFTRLLVSVLLFILLTSFQRYLHILDPPTLDLKKFLVSLYSLVFSDY